MGKEKKKKNLPKDNPSLEVIENTVKHIKEKVDEFSGQMKSVEKNLIQVSLNKQNINTLKNNIKNIKEEQIEDLKGSIKNINDVRIPNIKNSLKSKVDKFPFYLVLFAFTVLNGIISYLANRF